MTNYRQLAMIYLRHNQKRSAITMAGVALCVCALFVIMNLAVSYIVTLREEARKQIDHEAWFVCADRETAARLSEEECLKSAHIEKPSHAVAPSHSVNSGNDQLSQSPVKTPDNQKIQESTDNSVRVYVNFKNPYLMTYHAEKLSKKYDSAYQLSGLATYYLQDKENDFIYTFVLVVLFISYIFAILSVGLVRNSVQLISLEQVKDYGILRCIGATKRQLKGFIYRMGMLLELGGIALGTILGFVIYLIPARKMKLDIGFHIVVLPFILITFLGDLYFVMRENSRFLNHMTPMAALRGARLGNTEKLKSHRFGLIRKLFGYEGDYAFKNLMRSPSRFFKSVCSIAFGIGMVIVAFSISRCVDSFLNSTANHYGRYQLFGYTPITADTDLDPEVFLPEHNYIHPWLSQSRHITSAKPIYCSTLYPQNPTELVGHYTKEYASDSHMGSKIAAWAEAYDENEELSPKKAGLDLLYSGIELFGYDDEDFQSLKPKLASGTLNLSEQGIVLVNHSYATSLQTDLNGYIRLDYTVTDYQVGDTVTFVDSARLRELVTKRNSSDKLQQDDTAGESDVSSMSYSEYVEKKYMIPHEYYRELAKQGITKTYVIEGIVTTDTVLSTPEQRAHFILPLESYFQATETSKEHQSGQMYHLQGTRLDFSLSESSVESSEPQTIEITGQTPPLPLEMRYLELIEALGKVEDVIFWIALFVLFVVLLSVMNILNTTSSNLHLRRKEFAQLRVLGMSKKRLMKTVLMEGVLTAVAANILGIIMGVGFSLLIVRMLRILYHVEFHFPLGMYALAATASFLLLCGSIYTNLRRMKLHMAEELNENG